MKRFLCAVAAVALITPAAAMAQRPDNHSGDRHGQNQGHNQGRPAHAQQQNHQSGQGRRSSPNRQNRPNEVTRVNRVDRTTNVTRPAGERVGRTSNRNVFRIGQRPSSFHRIRAASFRYPRGYHYRRFSTGSILPSLFLSSLYFWSDYGALGLGAPPPGYVWVRYGPDLLLVNRYTGRIADVIYGAFY